MVEPVSLWQARLEALPASDPARFADALALLSAMRDELGSRREQLHIDDGPDEGELRLYAGDVLVDELSHCGTMLVAGDLTVRRGIWSSEDWATLIVAGTIRAANMVTQVATVLCGGDLIIDSVAFKDTIPGGHVETRGRLSAQLVIAGPDGEFLAAEEDVRWRFTSEDMADAEADPQSPVWPRLRAVLIPEVFDEDGELDRGELMDRLDAGEDVLLAVE